MNVASLQYRHQVNTLNTDRAKHFLIDEAEEFTRLYPEETKKRLGQLVTKIDSNRDGLVGVGELTDWIDLIHKDHIRRDVEREWLIRNPDQVDKLSWRLYKSNVYGALEDKFNTADTKSILEMVSGEQRRWKAADQDQDGSLNIVEFQSFLHPETDRRMEEVVLSEIMEDMDLDLDQRISLEEYITDMVSQQEEESSRESERVNFRDNIDLDQNGYLDRAEVRSWLMPVQYDYARGEAEFLIKVSDDDKDGSLTAREITDHYTQFTGSQATDYGAAITRHEEL